VIRPATVTDARALAELEVRAWRWAYVDIVAEQDMITVEEREARWASVGAVDGTSVVEVEGRVVGVAQAGADGDDRSAGPSVAGLAQAVAGVTQAVPGVAQAVPDPDGGAVGRLGVLAVEPAAQGAGLGAVLYDEAVERLRSAGFASAVVWLFAGDGHARGFYERRGWHADGETGTIAEAPALRYRQALAP
jgi:GNAT superfamily N-acetyltransferase